MKKKFFHLQKAINFSKISRLLLLFAVVCSFSFSLKAQASDKKVSGVILDEFGGPFPGVNVVVKGSTIGTITDIDGKFELLLEDKSATLVISYIGYNSVEMKASDVKGTIKLTEDRKGLDEIVVIGYGQVKKGDATGAVTAVSAKDFNKGAVTSPQELINGRVAGVNISSAGGQPGGEMKIRIRGGASLSAKNDPLFIVDGIPLDNSQVDGVSNPLSFINPSDIETFTVLKDASATAIYGLRATNGVIIITTKKGKKGGKINVSYDNKFTVGYKTNEIDVLSGNQYREMVKSLEGKQIAKGASKLLGNASTDWQDQIYQTATSQEHNLSVTGSMAGVPFRASGSFKDEYGLLKTSNFKKYTGSVSLTPSFMEDHLKLAVNFRATKIENRFADKGAIGNAIRMNPTLPVYNKTGIYGGYTTWKQANNDPIALATRNPLSQLLLTNDVNDVYRSIADAKVDYKFHFLPELTATAKVAYDVTKIDGEKTVDPKASWVQKSDNTLNTYEQKKTSFLLDGYFSYNKKFEGIQTKLSATAGYSFQKFTSDREPSYSYNSNTKVENTGLAARWEQKLIGGFGRLNLTFRDKYILTGTVRRDGTSRFGKDVRWEVFPSAAFAWRIMDEPFMKSAEVVSNLKLRFGWGITGQENIGDGVYDYYSFKPVYQIGDDKTQYPIGDKYYNTLRPGAYSEDRTWETTTTYNAGLDFGFLKNRINGSVDVYKRETEDLLNAVPIAIGSNFANIYTINVGSLENTGVEFSLNGVLIESKDLNWELGVNVAYNKNEVTKLTQFNDPGYKGVEVGGISGATGNNIRIHSVGRAANTFYVYEQVYGKDGKPIEGLFVDRNGDGKITPDDRYYAENPAPDVTLGFNSNFKYKNLDFSFAGRAYLGNYVYDNISSNNARYNNVYNLGYLSNVTNDIFNTQFSGSNDVFLSDYYIKDASFLKLDNITLGYDFTSLVKPATSNVLSYLRAYATVQNVFTVTDYDGLDPEVDIDGGIDNDTYPRPRVFLFGLNVKF